MLKFCIPKGSLEEKTLSYLQQCGYAPALTNRDYHVLTNDLDLNAMLCKPSEIPDLVAEGIFDAGICGRDCLVEAKKTCRVDQVADFRYSKQTNRKAMWVIAVPLNSPIVRLDDLNGKTVATEKPGILKEFLKKKGVTAEIMASAGATEAKVGLGLCDAVADITETGATLRAQNLRILARIMDTWPVVIANTEMAKDHKKKATLDRIVQGIRSCERANGMLLVTIHSPEGLPPALEQAVRKNATAVMDKTTQTIRAVIPEVNLKYLLVTTGNNDILSAVPVINLKTKDR